MRTDVASTAKSKCLCWHTGIGLVCSERSLSSVSEGRIMLSGRSVKSSTQRNTKGMDDCRTACKERLWMARLGHRTLQEPEPAGVRLQKKQGNKAGKFMYTARSQERENHPKVREKVDYGRALSPETSGNREEITLNHLCSATVSADTQELHTQQLRNISASRIMCTQRTFVSHSQAVRNRITPHVFT